MKLLCEFHSENKFREASAEDGSKHYYLEGIFLQANIKNRNGRIYPMDIMEKEVERYKKECIETHQSCGELGHPSGDGCGSINYENVSHIIEEIWRDGDYFQARARILDTPKGKIVQELIKGGVQLGVSSRALGSVKYDKDGVAIVQPDFHLLCVDVVSLPSSQSAYPKGIYESQDEYEFDPASGEYHKVDLAKQAAELEEYNRQKTQIQIKQFKELIDQLRA